MAIISILRGEFVANNLGNAGLITNFGSFVANNAVTELQCDTAAVSFRWTFSTDTGRYKFQEADNAILLSFWIALPYHYVWSRPGGTVSFYSGNTIGYGASGRVSPPDGSVVVPVANSEISLGVYLPWATGTGLNWISYGCQIDGPWVSQVGAVAALNGTRFYPVPCAKFLHNLPLTA